MRATIILVMALVIATPVLARCYKCIHRSSKARHEFLVETGHPNGWSGHIVDDVRPLAWREQTNLAAVISDAPNTAPRRWAARKKLPELAVNRRRTGLINLDDNRQE